MVSRLFLYLLLCKLTQSTVDLYSNVWDCTPPSLHQSYMGGPAQKGTQLRLFINDIPMEEFKGYSLEKEYKLKLKSSHDWYQYVIYINQGTLHYEHKETGCDGKRIMISDIDIEVEFTWKPSNDKDIATLAVGFAPHYTLISVQNFNILPENIDLDQKQEM
eukprot:277485_1